MRQYTLVIILLLICSHIFGQKFTPDFKKYKLEKIIKQNKSTFKFWRGMTDSTEEKIIIERILNGINTILYNDFIRDGIYKIADRNNDGYKDFITRYHDYDLIYLFNYKTIRFNEDPVYLPMTFALLDKDRKIYWGYRDAQYAEHYDYSILYKFKGVQPYFYYKIEFITKDENSERKYTTRIELYKFQNGKYENPIFVKRIKTNNPSKFDFKKYWRNNYKNLIEYFKQD